MQKKETVQLGITSVLVIALIFLVIHGVQSRRHASSPVAQGQSSAAAVPAVSTVPTAMPTASQSMVTQPPETSGQELFVQLDNQTESIEVNRDPFSKEVVLPKKPTHPLMYLTGILWDSEKPKAIINETILGVGDKVRGNMIVDIQRYKVVLHGENGYFELTIGEK